MQLSVFAQRLLFGALVAASAAAQNAQISAVAVQPNNAERVWVCNRDNATVSVIDVGASALLAEIHVGYSPRSLCFNQAGTKVFVANQRGNIPPSANAITGFPARALPGSISVIDVATLSLQTTLSQVGVEPYGVALAPNGKFIAVTGMRSGTVKLFDAETFAQRASFQYLNNLSMIPSGFTIADADHDRDGIADLGDPRGFTLRADSRRMYVTHYRSPFISALDIQLDQNGLPTGVTLAAKISTDDYHFDSIFNPTPVQIVKSQGHPRFLEDIALSPDGRRALIPHVLHNVNHDVDHDFGPGLAGAFANRVYPALTMIDTLHDSFGRAGDSSNRLHNELADSGNPAQYVPFGRSQVTSSGDIISLGGQGEPVVGGTLTLTVDGLRAGDGSVLVLGRREVEIPVAGVGIVYASPRFVTRFSGNSVSFPIANVASYADLVLVAQVLVTKPGGEQALSNGVRIVIESTGFGHDKMGYRAGQPSRVLFNRAGDRVLMLNRGSEDLFLYRVNGRDMDLMTVFPPRVRFVPRAPLSTDTPLGDLPIGMAIADDPLTVDDDARVFVMNEVTRTLSVLRVDWRTGQITKEKDQIRTHAGPDALTASQIRGEELFEDASRPQTARNFNNSCASCHFEGGEDGNVWQRPNGPRSTMPMYGGTGATGLLLWKGVRLNLGETGPMFADENGGTGIFTDLEQQSLVDFHETLAIPLNPNRDATYGLTPEARFGQDLFFGTNETGLNPALRDAGCGACHKRAETSATDFPGPRFFTADFMNPELTSGENLATVDPACTSLREGLVLKNLRNVNTAVNDDVDGDGVPDIDRNGDGYVDIETYTPMNSDKAAPFHRDDPNSYSCPCMIGDFNCDPLTLTTFFTRRAGFFSIPTKLGVFSTGPYFHDHAARSLRGLLDPDSQALSPIYGSPAYVGQNPNPGLNKIFNDVHDVRGHEQFVPNISKVQMTLHSTDADADIAAILAYIQSL